MQNNEQTICNSCGYDLQGIANDAPCPECGNTGREDSGDMSQGKFMRLINANIAVKGLEPLPDIRVRTKYWMRIGCIFVLAVLLLQLLVTFALIPIGLYRFLLFGLSSFWPTVVVGMMPANVDLSMPPMYRWLRKWTPPTQWCWVVGYVFWFVFHVPTEFGTMGSNLKFYWPLLALHFVGGIGIVGLAFWLHDLALRMDLHSAASKCNLVAVGFATWGILVFVLPWKHFSAAGLNAEQGAIMWWALILGLMLPWLWIMQVFARALYEFSSDSSWSMQYEEGRKGRRNRISKKREEYEKERGWQ
ncbi:MAG: hypothetical protein H8E86_05750 [Planctomycetes bacterium]|nr:hypothetical protein [Planctomycetota bacterium]